jgi:cytidine deaminase
MERAAGAGEGASDASDRLSIGTWEHLADAAWAAREAAFVFGPTMVGCAVLASTGEVCAGCNVEHRFRSHDVHAEVNAISSMVAAGQRELVAVLIVASRDQFTPCGACMDWIFQFGGPDCQVGYQREPRGPVTIHLASELMPYYPY